MKTKLTLFFCLILSIVQSQELKTIELLPPESTKHNDLSFLKDELQDKQLVMLGELTHMYGNIFEMKARVIEYLHQELGFTTIAMESSMYDIWKMNRNGFTASDFNDAVYGVWSSTIEFQRVVNYIEENNLKVIGFDSQIGNTSQFIEDFFDYCDRQKIAIKIDEDDLGIIIEALLDNGNIEEEDVKFSIYEKELNRIILQIGKLENNETNYYWKQFIKSLLACSQDAYYNKVEIKSYDLGNKDHNIRDKQMAENLLSYFNRNPNEKIIIWADNIHVMNDNSSIKKPIAKDFISMGSYIKTALKDKVYSLATIHSNDSLINTKTKKWDTTPIKNHSFEYELKQLNKPFLFVSSNQEAMQKIKETRLLNWIDFTEARLDQLHDGYIFFKNATLPKEKNIKDTITISNDEIDLSHKIELISAENKIIVRGQILDKVTKEPIAFATLILKKEEIYRVADEKGFYEFPVQKTMLQNASVEISAMGFESNTISLNALNDKTFLNPKFEKLAEVVVTGYLLPITVLKKAINKKRLNHPVTPFNVYENSEFLINNNDANELDLELITKDYDEGYLSPNVITRKVEQIKWNINNLPNKYKYTSQLFFFREDAIRYGNILHKRKYKKFKLNFEQSNNSEDDGFYIISFKTERNNWTYTNRGYPTHYSGKVYIDKEKFAIVKVIQNWESALNENEIGEYATTNPIYENIIRATFKEENICLYEQVAGDGKFYATKYFYRRYSETVNRENKQENNVFERNSNLFDLELNNIEKIEFEYHNNKEQTILNRVAYNQTFWDSFYQRKINKK